MRFLVGTDRFFVTFHVEIMIFQVFEMLIPSADGQHFMSTSWILNKIPERSTGYLDFETRFGSKS